MELEEQKMQEYFKPKLFTRINRTAENSPDKQSRQSPLQKSQIMYKEGMEKLRKMNERESSEKGHYDKELTLNPKIDSKSK